MPSVIKRAFPLEFQTAQDILTETKCILSSDNPVLSYEITERGPSDCVNQKFRASYDK